MIIPEHIVDQIREQADIVEIIGEDLELRKKGANYVALSPFTDEKTPSFTVSPDKQIFKDFSSGVGGNVFKFVMEYHRMTFPESVEYVANRVGIKLEQNKTSQDFKELDRRQKAQKAINYINEIYQKELGKKENIDKLNYFFSRGLNNEVISKFNLGYSPDSWDYVYESLLSKKVDIASMLDSGVIVKTKKGTYFDRFKGRAMFPIRDHIGRIVGFSGRQIVIDKKSGKYVNSPQCLLYDKSKLLYGLFESKDAIRNKNEVLLVEGQLDVISLHKVGIDNVVASSGTALTQQQVDLISRFASVIYFIYDSDDAGINAANKGIDLALKKEMDVKVVVLPKGDDPDSIINSNGKNTFINYLNRAIDFVEFKILRYKEANPKETAQSRAGIIRDLIKSISQIPDRFQHDHYLGRVAHFLDLSRHEQDLLYSEKEKLEIKNAGKLEFKQEKGTVANESDGNNFVIHNIQNQYEKSRLDEDASLKVAGAVLPEELILLKYALQGFNEINRMTDEFEISIDTFVTKEAVELFEILSNLSNVKGKSLLEVIQDSEFISEENKALFFGLTLTGEEKSNNWIKYRTIGVEHNLFADLADALIKLELKKLDTRSKNLLSLLKSESANKEEIQQDLYELTMHKNNLIAKLQNSE